VPIVEEAQGGGVDSRKKKKNGGRRCSKRSHELAKVSRTRGINAGIGKGDSVIGPDGWVAILKEEEVSTLFSKEGKGKHKKGGT